MNALLAQTSGFPIVTAALSAVPVRLVNQPPVEISRLSPGHWLVDFGRVASGNLKLDAPAGVSGGLTVHFGQALFLDGRAREAIALIAAPGDRSWRHMAESGTTITWEAWDQKYKPDQDWNHAWGAAPASLLPRFVLGAQPLAPGWKEILIKPHPGGLASACGKIPPPMGPLVVEWKRDASFTISITLPAGILARVELPAIPGTTQIEIDGKQAPARLSDGWWILENQVSGSVRLEQK